jgi:para-nitrobenzyl esterase
MKGLSIALCVAAASVLPLAAAIQEPVKVEGGLVSGTPGWAWGVREYRGIPFAAPPVGDLRWRPPQPVTAWKGVLAADHYSAACMQREPSPYNPGLMNRSEDCLYLNVWTPASSAAERLPVLVWIYGGGGIAGSTGEPIYDGNALAKKGVVVVSANYRVNVFGWFAHPELTKESQHGSSGNYGALDQVAALQWIQRNIAQFGGDASKVTIFGESGGCRSVNWLAASPLVKGLIRGAIAESHAVFGRMMTLSQAENMGAGFAKAAGKPSLAALRALSTDELLAASIKTPAATNGAIVDGWFLPKDIYSIYSEGSQNDVPLITGVTNDEGGAIAGVGTPGGGPREGPPNTLDTWTAWVKRTFNARADAVMKLYPAKNDAEAVRAYHDMYRDINFAGHRTWAKLQSTTGKAPVYLYNFSHFPPSPQGNGNNPPAPVGAVHFAEVIYVFNNLRVKDYPWTDVDRRIADDLSSYWTNFAKGLNPNGPGLTNWPVYNPKDEYWINFGDTYRLERFNSAGVDLISEVQEELRRAR